MKIVIFALLVLILVAGWVAVGNNEDSSAAQAHRIGNPDAFPSDILSESFGYGPEDLGVPIAEVFQGCTHRDCIPSIDQPDFLSVAKVDFLQPEDLVLAIHRNGIKRAYPSRILDVHEIVNDTFGNEPILATWCPLCGSGLAFIRQVAGKEVEFGVSGLLHNNDLIMYDRRSNSLWQQISGEAFAGPLKGDTLVNISSIMTDWASWSDANPDGEVLKPPHDPRDYERLRYEEYAQSDRLLFPVDRMDARLKPKNVVYGIKFDNQAIALESEWLSQIRRWSRQTDSGRLVVEVDDSGAVTATLDDKRVPANRMFWFAWYSFNPNSALIDEDSAP